MRAALAMVVLVACGASEAPVPQAAAPAPPSAASTASAAPAAPAAPATPRLPMKPGVFAPSLVAFTGSGGDVSLGNALSDVDTCASCHPDAAAQWNTSPHSFASFGNPIYRYDVELARADLGKQASNHCGGC